MSTAGTQEQRPEWLRVSAAVAISGICRSLLYTRMQAGDIKSRIIKERNATRGIRLINYDSLMAFIEGSEDGAKAKTSN